MSRRAPGQSAWQVFRWPLLIAVSSLVGLLSALLGDGWADILSWLLLGGLLVLISAAYRGNRINPGHSGRDDKSA